MKLVLVSVFYLLLNSVQSSHLFFGPWTPPDPNPSESNYPICIVGTGISGLHLGNILQAKGYRVQIFEEKSRVGGKAATYREGNSVLIEKGPIFISPNNAPVLAYVNQFNLTTATTNQSDLRLFDSENGSIQPVPILSPETRSEIAEAIQRYIQYYNTFREELESGYLKPASELYVPFATWMTSRNLSILLPLFIFPVTIEGFGDLNDTPALYVLKLVRPVELDVLVSGTSTFLTLREGMDVLMDRMADTLDVHLNQGITRVVRHNSGYQELHCGDLGTVMKCSKTILAFPPLLKKLEKVIPDLTADEREVFGKVRIHRYTSSGYHLPPLDHRLYYEGIKHPDLSQPPYLVFPRGIGEVIGILRQSHGV